MQDSGSKLYQKARCHPMMRNVAPKVEYVWNMFPFNLLTGQLNSIVNLILFPFCWFVYIPFQICVADPWNIFWSIIVCGPFFFLFIFVVMPWFLGALVVSLIYLAAVCCGLCGTGTTS